MNTLKIALIILTSVFFIACEEDVPPPPPPVPGDWLSEENQLIVDNIVDSIMNIDQTPGVVIGLHSPALGTYMKAYGVANVNSGAAMTVDAVFDIGSVQKNFRWVLIYLLQQEGLLSIEDEVNAHIAIPDLPGVKIKHLMSHSSGLIDQTSDSDLIDYILANIMEEIPYETSIDFLDNANGVNPYGAFTNGRLDGFDIGNELSYSSYGPLIAGKIAEAVTGENVRTLVKDKIITPLGLLNTTHQGYDGNPDNLVDGHTDPNTVYNNITEDAQTLAFSSCWGGLLYSDAADLLELVKSEFTDPNFISDNARSTMYSIQLSGFGMSSGYGITQFDGMGDFWGHGGASIHSHSSLIAHRASDRFSIVVLTNINHEYGQWATNIGIVKALGEVF